MIDDKRYQEVVDCINSYYGSKFTVEDVVKYITDLILIQEIVDNSYRDTSPREEILCHLSEGVVGMEWPCNGDTMEYKILFYTKAGLNF